MNFSLHLTTVNFNTVTDGRPASSDGSKSPFLFKRQSAPSVLSKLSRADNASDPIKNPAHQPVFFLQEGILLTGHFGRVAF